MDLTTGTIWLFLAQLFMAATILRKIATRERPRTTSAKFSRPPPPPMTRGAPLLGLVANGSVAFIRDHYEKMGCVFTICLLQQKVTFLVGSEVSNHFYKGLDSEISQDEVSQFTIPTFGPGVAVTLQDGGQSGTVNMKQEFEQLVTLIASRCLLGEEVRDKMFGEVSTLLRELNDGMRLITILFPRLPIPAHRRRDRARARLGKIFSDIGRSRRSNRTGGGGARRDDLLQCLIDARYKDGRATTETEVAGILVAALFAGQHTSSSTSTWTGARLLTNLNHLRAAAEEQARILRRHGDRVDHAALAAMDTLQRCVKETLRLHPPAMMLLRHARRSFVVRGEDSGGGEREYEVPKGHTVASPLLLHNELPQVYRDPREFDPDRFGAGREEGGGLAYTAFGGGRHACVGEAFAYMQIKVI
uniref:Cytochrome P450 n=1 Tax=Oryza punctata TaxID=4537 RepID=A0A0E0KZR8_ORYPU